jgi:hypothetical protein
MNQLQFQGVNESTPYSAGAVAKNATIKADFQSSHEAPRSSLRVHA